MSDTPNPADTDPNAPHQPNPLFLVAPDVDNHTLLEYACVSLASANVMASDFARSLSGVQGSTLLGIQQSIMLGEMAVNRVLDNLDSA
jgi:hypothetical protein